MRHAVVLSFLLGIFAVISGCEEHNGPFYFENKGVVQGVVHRSASFSHDNIEVRLIGANYNQHVLTNEVGEYQFFHVPTTNLEIQFRDEGYGTLRFYNIRQSGLDTITNPGVYIYSIPESPVREISEVSTGIDSNDQPFLLLNFKDQPSLSFGRIFFSLSPDVSHLNYEISGHIDNQPNVSFQKMYFSESASSMFDGFKTVYFKIYPNGGGAYFDYTRDLWIYSSVNADLATQTYEFKFPK